MTENLSGYSLPQLKQLRVRIEKEIAKQELAGKASVLKKLQKLARAHGMTLDEVLGATAQVKPVKAVSKAPAVPKAPVPVKYRHPSKQDLAWSGRGRRPQWVETWLSNGGALDALMISAQKFEKKLQRKADASKSAPKVVAAVSQDAGETEAAATTE
ncbi:H-NS family nucleoid-associated regulatory protein [Azoarcus sp. KH32C]|uniref:H-NS histone family protein n=1 Tax=Azoarcus sp. KH32C TaxID=748247 RepID=UPI000238680B|nr:H-NS histone family protein [Azoarcus sp. KH32C]BAL23718.1 DNA-binding protein, histone-like nucleoid-structuring protein H-NS [Azoarcus sp. KH32C]